MPWSDYSSENESFYCQLCNRNFKRHRELVQHNRDTARHSWCEKCNQVFENNTELDEHFHSSYNHNMCVRCRIDFNTSYDLQNHIYQSHDICTSCHEYFDSADNLREVCEPRCPIDLFSLLRYQLCIAYVSPCAARP